MTGSLRLSVSLSLFNNKTITPGGNEGGRREREREREREGGGVGEVGIITHRFAPGQDQQESVDGTHKSRQTTSLLKKMAKADVFDCSRLSKREREGTNETR